MPVRLHPLMQDAYDFDDARLGSPVKDHMHGRVHGRLMTVSTAVADVIAAKTRKEFAPVDC